MISRFSKTNKNGKMRPRRRIRRRLSRNKSRNLKDISGHGILILVKRAEDLPSADSNGLSDPFVRFFIGKRALGKSSVVEKTLNPVWHEEFFTKVSSFSKVLRLEVRDRDRFSSNDYLGEAEILLSDIFGTGLEATDDEDFARTYDLELALHDRRKDKHAGKIFISLRRSKKLNRIEKPKWQVGGSDAVAKQIVVDLVSAKDLIPMDRNGKSDPFCVLNFQGTKKKSKVVRFTTEPTWRERFDFTYETREQNSDDEEIISWEPEWGKDQVLTIELFDWDSITSLHRREYMGVAKVDISELADQRGGANEVWAQVINNGQPAGVVRLIISVLDLLDHHFLTYEQLEKTPAYLKVLVLQAVKPKAKGSKRSCYVEIAVGSSKLRTQPVEDNRSPIFERLLEIPVNDLYTTCEISLWERRYDSLDDKPNLVGKMVAALFDLPNSTDEWFQLKDEKLEKAVNAHIRIATKFVYPKMSVKNVLQLVKRHEVDAIARRESPTMKNMRIHLGRVSFYFKQLNGGIKYCMDLLKWEYGFFPSVAGMVIWFLFCFFFRNWFLPLVVYGFLQFTKRTPEWYGGDNLIVDENGEVVEDKLQEGRKIHFADKEDDELDEYPGEPEEVHEDEHLGLVGVGVGVAQAFVSAGQQALKIKDTQKEIKAKKKNKTTLAERVAMPMKLLRMVQHTCETIANYYENCVGLFTWTNPNFTELISNVLLVATVGLFFIPLNYILIAAVEWQFIKRGLRKYKIAFVRKPHFIPYQPAIEILKKIPTFAQRKKRARVVLTEDKRKELEQLSTMVQARPLIDELVRVEN